MKRSCSTFLKEIYRDNKLRVKGKRNLLKDIGLFYRNKNLISKEKKLIERYNNRDFPIVFVLSVPRSGTTFLSQFIADNFDIAFINNYMSKYFLAPLYALIKFERKGQKDLQSYQSDLGNTKGDHAPHEFGYFWQYYLNHSQHDHLSDEELDLVDWEMLRKELYGISAHQQKPLMIKSLVYTDYYIERLAKEFPNSKFIYIKRDPVYVFQSIYESRIKRYGSPDIWWSIRPRNWMKQTGKSPLEQIAYQYQDVSRHIESSLAKLENNRKITIQYEDLVAKPKEHIQSLAKIIGIQAIDKEQDFSGLNKQTNKQRLNDELFAELNELIKNR